MEKAKVRAEVEIAIKIASFLNLTLDLNLSGRREAKVKAEVEVGLKPASMIFPQP